VEDDSTHAYQRRAPSLIQNSNASERDFGLMTQVTVQLVTLTDTEHKSIKDFIDWAEKNYPIQTARNSWMRHVTPGAHVGFKILIEGIKCRV
jgi:hypothetical protein